MGVSMRVSRDTSVHVLFVVAIPLSVLWLAGVAVVGVLWLLVKLAVALWLGGRWAARAVARAWRRWQR